jgi:Spy/CpxP family protein refolding chaperone
MNVNRQITAMLTPEQPAKFEKLKQENHSFLPAAESNH